MKETARKVCDCFFEALTYMSISSEDWTKIRTNHVIEKMNQEIRCRPHVVGAFPDCSFAIIAGLRLVDGPQWGGKEYR